VLKVNFYWHANCQLQGSKSELHLTREDRYWIDSVSQGQDGAHPTWRTRHHFLEREWLWARPASHVRLGSPSEPDLTPDLNGIPLQTHLLSEWGSVSGLCACECDAILETGRQCLLPIIPQSHVKNTTTWLAQWPYQARRKWGQHVERNNTHHPLVWRVFSPGTSIAVLMIPPLDLRPAPPQISPHPRCPGLFTSRRKRCLGCEARKLVEYRAPRRNRCCNI
jgi:hypothetical protein